ncbi:hypothetical protein J31TS4_37320 [Paenibacillus sp. J31TS4]|nr:hypothetical protein J31TS4_37320 [Paenibacillus sp. J31TS4]
MPAVWSKTPDKDEGKPAMSGASYSKKTSRIGRPQAVRYGMFSVSGAAADLAVKEASRKNYFTIRTGQWLC